MVGQFSWRQPAAGCEGPCHCGLEAPADAAPASLPENQAAGTLLRAVLPLAWLWWWLCRLGWRAHACVGVYALLSAHAHARLPGRTQALPSGVAISPTGKPFTRCFCSTWKGKQNKPAPERVTSERPAPLGPFSPGTESRRAPARPCGVSRLTGVQGPGAQGRAVALPAALRPERRRGFAGRRWAVCPLRPALAQTPRQRRAPG